MSKQDTYPPNFDRKSESSFPLARSDSGVGSKPRVTMEVYTGLEGEPAFSGKLWSKGKKALVTLALCIAVLASSYSSSGYTSSISHLMVEFGMSERMAYAGVSFYVLGYALGPLTWAPFSSLWGKRPIYIGSYILFAAFMWGAAYAPNTGGLMVFRFLAGFCSCSTLNNVGSSIGDYTTLDERPLHFATFAFFAFGGPCLGPLIGGLITVNASSDWNMIVMAIFASVSLVLVSLVPETYIPVLARKHAQANVEKNKAGQQGENEVITALWQPFYLLITEVVLASICVYLAILYALIYAFFAVFPTVYIDQRHWSVTDLSYSYFALATGFFLGTIFIIVIGGVAKKKRERLGIKQDLYDIFKIAYLTSWMIPAALFIIAFASDDDTSPVGNLIAEVLFGWGVICQFMSLLAFVVNMYNERSASAVGAGTFLRSLFAAAFPLFINDCVDKIGVDGTCGLFGAIGVLAIPLPFLIEKSGKRERARKEQGGA